MSFSESMPGGWINPPTRRHGRAAGNGGPPMREWMLSGGELPSRPAEGASCPDCLHPGWGHPDPGEDTTCIAQRATDGGRCWCRWVTVGGAGATPTPPTAGQP